MLITSVSEIIFATIKTQAYEPFLNTLGIVIIVLLIILFTQKEMMRAWGGARAASWGKTLTLVIIPLLFAFGLIILMRLAALL